MAIEIQVPREITAYQAKVVMGMSWRQLACAAAMTILGFATIFVGYLADFVETSQYIVIAIIIPFAALGWYRPRGLPFEKYAGYIINHQRSRQLYVYGMISQVQPSADGGPVPRKAKRNHKKTKSRRKGSLPVERDSYV